MRTQTSFQFIPSSQSDALKYLIFATCALSIGLPVLDGILGMLFKKTGVQLLMSLMWNAWENLYLWQPFSYMFLMQPAGGISIGLLIGLFFRMYLIWIIGGTLVERFGVASFFKLYLGTGVFTALAYLFLANTLGLYGVLTGNTAPLLAIFVMWSFMNPDGVIFLFFLFPIRVKWLLAGIVGFTLLTVLSEGSSVQLITVLSGVLCGYLYSTMGWGLHSPFQWTYETDRWLSRFGDTLGQFLNPKSYAKVFDLNTGKGRNEEEAFVDAMLEKISKSGKESLTLWEKYKLYRISKKKKR